jgi:hypothetical protein
METSLGKISISLFEKDVKEKPRTVYGAMRIINISEVDFIRNRVEIDFYLFLTWSDPAMVGIERGDPRFNRTAEEYETLWNPRVEINNAVELQELHDADMAWNFLDPKTGLMAWTQRYKGYITCEHTLEDFPFDCASITIAVGCKIYEKDSVVLAVRILTAEETVENYLGIIQKASLTEWDLDRGVVTCKQSSSLGYYATLEFCFQLNRRYSFYMWKIVSVLLILSSISWVCPFMGAEEFADRINLLTTLLLSAVALMFAITESVPKVSYLTVLDKFVLLNFGLLFVIAVESFIVYVVNKPQYGDSPDVALRIDQFFMPLMPLFCMGGSCFVLCQRKKRKEEVIEQEQVCPPPLPLPGKSGLDVFFVVKSIKGQTNTTNNKLKLHSLEIDRPPLSHFLPVSHDFLLFSKLSYITIPTFLCRLPSPRTPMR